MVAMLVCLNDGMAAVMVFLTNPWELSSIIMQTLLDVVGKNYMKAQKYLTMKSKLTLYWLIVFVTMTTPIFLHDCER